MEIHRFEAIWIVASLLLIGGFIATVAYGAVGVGIEMVDDEGGTVDASSLRASQYGGTGFSPPGVYAAEDGRSYDAYVIVRQFEFLPGTREPLRLPANRPVTLHLTSTDVIHGFAIPGTNVNVMVIPGQVAKITVVFDEPGEYGIVCHEYCGAGHHTMEGLVTVVPPNQYEGA